MDKSDSYQRRTPRINMPPVSYHVVRGVQRGRAIAVDVSEGGMCLRTDLMLKIGDRIEIFSPDGSCVWGEVRWIRDDLVGVRVYSSA